MRKAVACNLTEAKKERRALVAEVDNGRAPVETGITLADLRERHLADVATRVALRKLSTGTERRYAWAWDQADKYLRPTQKVRDIRTDDIARCVNELQRKDGLSVASANLVLSVLSAAFNDAVRRSLVVSNPCSRLGSDRPGAGTERDSRHGRNRRGCRSARSEPDRQLDRRTSGQHRHRVPRQMRARPG